MNILFHVHWEFSTRQAGSERYTKFVADYLTSKGHKCTYVLESGMYAILGKSEYDIDGSKVYVEGHVDIDALYKESDVVWTHLQSTRKAITLSRKHKKPLCVVQHNDGQLPMYDVKNHEVELVVYNSQWLKNRIEPAFKSKNHFVLIPPLKVSEWEVDDLEKRFITHVNCNKGKGTLISRHVASMTQEHPWLFVMGSYFEQYVPKGVGDSIRHLQVPFREIDFTPNCVFSPLTTNMRDDIWSQTKIFITPSTIDTWGMAACEAMSSGIPVIAHPDPGFQESLGYAGLFVIKEKVQVQADLIKKLMTNEDYYKERSELSRKRALEIENLSEQQVSDLEKVLLSL